jgi:AcrR family transcriptional regulator
MLSKDPGKVNGVHLRVQDKVNAVHLSSGILRAEAKVARTAPREDAPAVRERLSRARVITAAVVLADERGIDSLTMRGLAEELGVVATALYKHVADKDELLDGMVEVVFAEVEFPAESDWETALRERALSMRQALLRHPWAIALMEARTAGPASLRHRDAVMRCLRETAGLSIPMALHAYSLSDSYIYGFAFQQTTMTAAHPTKTVAGVQDVTGIQPPPGAEYPHLNELLVALGKSGYDYNREFEFGLDVLLDGIARLREQELASAKR